MTGVIFHFIFFSVLLLLSSCTVASPSSSERTNNSEFCEHYVDSVGGHQCTVHSVTTDDGFVLKLHRIQAENPTNDRQNDNARGLKFPVLLDHAMFLGGDVWFNLLPDKLNDKNLPLFLSKFGFDVWISNHRGSKFSYQNIYHNASDREFWDWSFDELASIDLPAMIGLIQTTTDTQKLHLVGFNQGGMLPIILASTMPSMAKALASCVLIAPPVYFENMTSPTLRNWARTAPDQIIYLLNVENSRFNYTVVKEFLAFFINFGIPLHRIVVVGSNSDEMISNVTGPNCCLEKPAGVALEKIDSNWVVGAYKNLAHYQQMMMSQRFRRWNYATSTLNTRSYSSSEPPIYYPNMVPDDIPIMVVNGGNDWFSNVQSVNKLLSELRGQIKHLFLPEYAHLDFIYSQTADTDVFKPIADYIKTGYMQE